MRGIVGVTELQRHFRAIFDDVSHNGTPYVLTRGSRPEAALIAYEEYLRLQALQEQDVLRSFDRLMVRMADKNAEYGEDEVERDVAQAKSEI